MQPAYLKSPSGKMFSGHVAPAHMGVGRLSAAIFSTYVLLTERPWGLPKRGTPLKNICFAFFGGLLRALPFLQSSLFSCPQGTMTTSHPPKSSGLQFSTDINTELHCSSHHRLQQVLHAQLKLLRYSQRCRRPCKTPVPPHPQPSSLTRT